MLDQSQALSRAPTLPPPRCRSHAAAPTRGAQHQAPQSHLLIPPRHRGGRPCPGSAHDTLQKQVPPVRGLNLGHRNRPAQQESALGFSHRPPQLPILLAVLRAAAWTYPLPATCLGHCFNPRASAARPGHPVQHCLRCELCALDPGSAHHSWEPVSLSCPSLPTC